MNLTIVILFLLVGAAAVVAVVLYTSYEKPIEQQPLQYNNLTLMAFDESTKMPVRTGYVVSMGGILAQEGKTLKDGRVFIQLPVNQTFTVFSENIENQTLYASNATIVPQPGSNAIKLDLALTPEGNLTLSHTGDLESDEEVSLIINATGTVKDIGFCLRWSRNIITVKNNISEEIPIPKRLHDKADRCYSTHTDLNNSQLIIPLKYGVFGSITQDDYITVTIIDGDLRWFSPEPIVEEQNGSDVGIPDRAYAIHSSESG